MPDELLLPAGARLVHLGPPKTGTTSLQSAFFDSREEIARHGVAYPGRHPRPRRAGWAFGLPGAPRGGVPRREWDDFAAQVRAAGDQRVCVSDENYARADADQARRLVEELGGDAVHVVAVARRLDRYLPSEWQQRVRAGYLGSFEDWLRRVLADGLPDDPEWSRVWMGHDTAALVERWTEVVGPGRFTLIVADETDRGQLTDVFSRLLGLPAGVLRIRTDLDRVNQSLSWAEAELIRGLNAALVERGWDSPDRVGWSRAAVRGLRRQPATGSRGAVLPGWAFAQVREISERRIAEIAALPVRVVGDPEHLRLPDDAPDPVDPATLGLPVGVLVDVLDSIAESAGATPAPTGPTVEETGSRDLLRVVGRRLRSRLRRGLTQD